MNQLPYTAAKLPRLLRKLVALIVTVAVLALVLMFSAVLLAVIFVVGTIAWAYLWWKTREVRKQMREFQARATQRTEMASNDEVFEGEVIRVVDPENKQN
jgi:ABC-type bacteriocin/lantibiotic exporter with double-glycine peptidase domain